ncbi:MAG: hypothetical protein U0163_12255 [Gemmatimonadaceae bacterium]
MHVDSRSGALRSLRYRGVELVDATGGGLAQYWYVAGRLLYGATTVSDARLTVTDSVRSSQTSSRALTGQESIRSS